MSSYDLLTQLAAGLPGFDLSDQSSITSQVVGVNIAFIVIAALTTALRLYIRLFMVRAAGLDDLLMVLAAISAITLCSFCLVGAHYGLGQHIWNLSSDPQVFLGKAQGITKSLFGCYLAYATATNFVKCSIIASYLRLFPNPILRRVVLATGAITNSLWIGSIFTLIFQCNPVQAAWDWTITNGKCIDIVEFLYVSSGINIATDVILFLAPLPLFWRMNMLLSQRLIICFLFGLGAFACVASILRLAQLQGLRSIDLTYSSIPSITWSVVEVGTAILCASVPSMRPLAKYILPRSLLSIAHPSSHRNNKTPSRASDITDADWRKLSNTQSINSPAQLSCKQTPRGSDGVTYFPTPALDISPKRIRSNESGEMTKVQQKPGDESEWEQVDLSLPRPSFLAALREKL